MSVPDDSQHARLRAAESEHGSEATFSRRPLSALASHLPSDRPHVVVCERDRCRRRSLRSIASRPSPPTCRTVTYGTDGLSQALKAVAGAMVRGIGTKVFWVQTGGFDTHASARARRNGGYANLMGTLNTALTSFYTDLESGASARHARAAVLRVRPAHRRERQPGHRPRRGRGHDGASAAASMAASTARRRR